MRQHQMFTMTCRPLIREAQVVHNSMLSYRANLYLLFVSAIEGAKTFQLKNHFLEPRPAPVIDVTSSPNLPLHLSWQISRGKKTKKSKPQYARWTRQIISKPFQRLLSQSMPFQKACQIPSICPRCKNCAKASRHPRVFGLGEVVA